MSCPTVQIKRAYACDYKDLFLGEKIAPGMVHCAADAILAFYRRDAEEDIGTDKKVLCGLCVSAVELGFLGEEHEIIDQ